MTKTFSFVVLIALFIVSCTTTTTKTKDPIFSKSTNDLEVELKKLVSSEGINLDGKEITTNGKTSSELQIDIKNGQNIPIDKNQMNELGRQIAIVVKNALQDKNEYNTYKVLFVTIKEEGASTQKDWKGKIFESEEL